MKRWALIIAASLALGLILVIVCAILIKGQRFSRTQTMTAEPDTQAALSEPMGEEYNDANFFLSAIKQTKTQPATIEATGLIVPHHLLAKDLIADSFAYISANQYKDIVLLSPDHFLAGRSEISVTDRDFSTVFGVVATDKSIVYQLKKLPFVSEGDFFYREHGLQAQLPFLKYYFPDAKVIAITFQPSVSRAKLDQVVSVLKNTLPPNSLIVQSTDFSHYLTPAQASLKDAETIKTINAENLSAILGLKQPSNLDSIAALYVQTALQTEFFQAQPTILNHKNSQDYTSETVTSSTSYVTAVYQPIISKSATASGNAELIFVGDIMLSRYIGEMMAKHQDYNLPFEKIAPELSTADLVFGNLETPVSNQGESAGALYPFRADPLVLSGLKDSGFKVVSVANNHAFDYKRPAFMDTLNNLKAAGIAYAGGGYNFAEAHAGATQEINGVKITILAYTDLLPPSDAATANQAGITYLDEAQMVKDIKEAKAKSDLVVVSFHWGQEYQTKSNAHQQKIALAAVQAGADLLVGHHPHVPQEVAKINGITVAYSLGNFIFDQNFSTGTKTGLMLKVEVKNKKIANVEPQTIKFSANFQPYLTP